MDITTETARHPLPDGEIQLLGAIETVTGSMSRIETGGLRMLVDCGVAQGREAGRWRFPDAACDVDALLLTHGHGDHVGSLPVLLERGFAGPIYGTRATLEIADLVVRDGLHLQGEGQLANDQCMAALASELDRQGADWHEGVEVHALQAGRMQGTRGGEAVDIAVDLVVDARGVGSKPALPALRGVRGEVLRV